MSIDCTGYIGYTVTLKRDIKCSNKNGCSQCYIKPNCITHITRPPQSWCYLRRWNDMARCEGCIHQKVCMHRANIQNDTYAYMGVKYDTEKC